MTDLQPYLQPSRVIDFDDPDVAALAQRLGRAAASEQDLIRQCFEFVRDEIQHSGDFKRDPVTCRASDVLRHGTGYCYAKSHLLAALLRANGVPTGLCYQRMSLDNGAFCLHGLNAVHLGDHGWFRLDPRGNKPGIDAQFCPPVEQLAFRAERPSCVDLPEIWPEPLPVVVEALERHRTCADLSRDFPDIELLGNLS